MRNYGMMWLPADLFVWQPLAFAPNAIGRVAFVHNAFRQKLRNWQKLKIADGDMAGLAEARKFIAGCRRRYLETASHERVRHWQELMTKVRSMFTQMIVSKYAAHIIQLWHADSHGGHLRDCDPDACEFRLRVSDEKYRGVWGLT